MRDQSRSTPDHRRAWELIPWVVNGHASAEDCAHLREHLRDCGDCREEFGFQQRLLENMRRSGEAPGDPKAAFDKLWARIVASGRTAPVARTRAGTNHLARWLAVAVVVEALGLAALSADLLRSHAERAPYRTLSTPAPDHGATVRAVLAPQLSVSELQGLLAEAHLQIVAGPSEAGVYSLAPRGDLPALPTERSLAALRAHPGVRFAEPVLEPAR